MMNRMFAFCSAGIIAAACTLYEGKPNMYDSGEDIGNGTPMYNAQSGWSAAGDLIPGEGKEVALQQEFQRAGTYVVQFSLERPSPQSPAVTVVQAEALILFSVAGVTTSRRISVGDGVSIAGNCEHISIRVIDTSAPAVFPDVIDETYRVRILLSRGSRASIAQPPTLIAAVNQASLAAAGGSITFPVPTDAGAVSVHVDVATTAGAPLADNEVQVEHLTDAAATFVLKQYDPRTDTWVPLAQGCRIVRITNRTAAQLIRVRLTFGIDG